MTNTVQSGQFPIAPWEVEVCCLRADDEECKKVADDMYTGLQDAGIETIYDDRDVRPGAMFSDADLIGAPIRVGVSPRNFERNQRLRSQHVIRQ